MTQPAAASRHTVDSITDDQLDQLQADLAWAREQTLAAQQETTDAVTRAERAEAALNAVRAELDRIAALPTIAYDDGRADTFPVGARWTIRVLRENALGEPQKLPAGEPPVHIGGRANAEDCPACEGTNPPYPFICPGPR